MIRSIEIFRRLVYFGFVFVAIFFFTTQKSRAALMAYEGFSYTVGASLTISSVNSPGDSFGWGGVWAGATLATNVATSLSYVDVNGNFLLTDGGKAIIGAPGATGNSQPGRSFNFGTLSSPTTGYMGITNSPGTYWASYLMQWVGPPTIGSTTNLYGRKGDLVFRQGALTNSTAGGGTALHTIGSPNVGNRIGVPFDTWSTWSGGDASPGSFNTGFAVTTNALTQVTLVLVRFNLGGNSAVDTVYTWFNWTNLNVEPPISLASTTNVTVNEDGLNNIRLDANGGNGTATNALLAFDEFRFGNTFVDVVPIAFTPQPPTITAQPPNQTLTEGTSGQFSVTAVGDPVLHYQWYFNTNNALGTDTNVLALVNVQSNNAGPYFVVVSNLVGSATSLVATLTIAPPMPPEITTPPASQVGIVGESLTFAVAATGSPQLRYQWYYNTNTPVASQTNAAFTLSSLTTNDAGNYLVIVTNLYGSVTSSVAVLSVIPPYEQLPAFPGADGAARYVSGGRGGIVYHVTKLDRNYGDTSAGTLRYGLTDANFPGGQPRTIVFDVAGVFWLGRFGMERPEYDNGWDTQSRINVPNNCTVAGQTAPGPVIIMGGTTKPGGRNIILRNMTFAAGYGMSTFNEPDSDPVKVPTVGDYPDSYVYDAFDVTGQNVMLDHLTTLYGTDETISCNELAANLTVQYCNISQGQNYPQADAESPGVYTGHALGSLLQAGSNARISFVNNLFAHLKGRLPRVGSEKGTGPFNDFRNNIFYNWFGTAGSGASGQPCFNNFINNFYLAGPGGDDVSGTNVTTGNSGGTGIFNGSSAAATRAYVAGNLKDTDKDGNPMNTSSADGNFSTITAQSGAYGVNIGLTLGATAAFTNVLQYVGARWWDRPYNFTTGNTNVITTNDIGVFLDERLIKETVTGTGKITAWADDPFNSDPAEGWEWRRLLSLRADSNTFSAPFNRPVGWDTDGDGMPDQWETQHGLNPNVANPNGDFDNDGYTDLEEYLNEVAAWPAPGIITFNNTTNSRYAEIYNWSVSGAIVNIGGTNTVTSSKWQPSRYDTAFISNRTCIVDAVGQHAGILRLATNAVLNITNGWLNVGDKMDIGAGCTVAVSYSGSLRVTNNLVNNGTLRLTGSAGLTVGGSITNNGLLDIMTWSGTLPPGFVNNGVVLDYSLVTVGSAAISGTNFVVTIQGYTGHNYQLQYRDDLLSGTWIDVGSPVPGNDAPIILPHVGGAAAQSRYYHVAVSP